MLESPFRPQRGSGRIYRGLDFGYRHPYVVWLHLSPDEMMTVFAEWEGRDSTLDELMAGIRAMDDRFGLSESDVAWTGADPAGAAPNDAGISPSERLRSQGFKVVWRSSEIMTGIELIKALLRDATGRVWLRFSPTVTQTLDHLQHYRWETGRNRPVKDNLHDHANDALRYLIVNLTGQR